MLRVGEPQRAAGSTTPTPGNLLRTPTLNTSNSSGNGNHLGRNARSAAFRGRSRHDSFIGSLPDMRRSSSTPRRQVSLNQSPSPASGSVRLELNQDGNMEDVEDLPDEVIMALDVRDGGTMGCAFFTTADGTLSLADDVPLADDSTAEHFIVHVQPTTLLVSARAPETLLAYLERQVSPDVEHDRLPRFVLRALASSDFSPSSAHARIGEQQVGESLRPTAIFSTSVDGNGLEPGVPVYGENAVGSQEATNFKMMRFGSIINLESHASVCCAGAVLAELHRRRSNGCFLADGTAMPSHQVASVQMFSLANSVLINAETLQSLQIVQTELHPNSQSWGPDPDRACGKESLSIYGLLQPLASTPQGRTSLRRLVLRPTFDLEILSDRHRTITVLLHPENSEKTKWAASILRKIQNMRACVSQLSKGVNYPSSKRTFNRGVWASIRRFAVQALELRELAGNFSGKGDITAVHELVAKIKQPALLAVGEMIDKIIDFDQSESRQRASVKAGIDPQLDQLKRQYDGMNGFLTAVVRQVNQELPGWARQHIRSCIFLPQVGFLMAVELDPLTGNGKYEGEGDPNERWEKLFTADDSVCYKNHYMTELDAQYGDIYCEIGDREVEIIHRLATAILEYEDDLYLASDACGNFDALLALAVGAEKYNWTAPQMVQASTIRIEEGRHPLMELVVPCFVPNNCDLGGAQVACDGDELERGGAMVLTGPNQSGKSVYLKQVAIIVYLAHIGSFVPASRAIIGITDKIITRISTRESMCRTQSAFAIDLKQVAQAMRCTSSMSLVVIDEFGKGTNPDDGAGLFAATLAHFLSLGPNAPRLLIATHFHEVFEGGFFNLQDNLHLNHMEVSVDWDAGRIEDQITYLFKLASAHSSSSFGTRCAALSGVPREVVERAEEISLHLHRGEDLRSFCAKASPEEEAQLERAERMARRFLEKDFDDLTNASGRADSTLKAVLCDIIPAGY
ncbi:hypothetical protein HIM_09407 [Hirsutella minnesotensis 3608]|uniref:DNA mismatch repair protein MSH5 n=1 Tax=Hirsutella minnesotensis 3608 TaxID=1043627 RepID=A0A0F7ZGN5_9HYPO|nr:hypothetical protein HIM_09407 [Hirsutella minnesotensis 3608]